MAKPLKQLLAEPDDFALCDGLFKRILEYHGDEIDPSALSEEERVVLLVWHVSGIIGNGGFRYLFEGNLPGDPTFALTAEAFRTIGCEKATEAVQVTFAIFPDSRPPTNIKERLRLYLQRITEPTDMELKFWDAQDELKKSLASYIRSCGRAYAHLDKPKQKNLINRSQKPRSAAPQKQRIGPTLSDLPRWARVAFAARCARQVFPFLVQHWPKVPSRHSDAVRLAIELAEQSAAEGSAVEGLEDVDLHVTMAAGAALLTRPEFAREDPRPENAFFGTIASLVAKAAQRAAKSASANAEDSLLAASEAWDFAETAADYAGADAVVEKMKEELGNLCRLAARGKWTDQTKIPSEVWTVL